MERCPNCRARWDEGETCRRCGMALQSLLAVEQAVDALIRRALGQLAGGDGAAAVRTLIRARALHPGSFIDQLLGFARYSADLPPGPDQADPAALGIGCEVTSQ